MRTVSEAMAAVHRAMQAGTFRPDLGAVRTVETALRQMTPEQLSQIVHPSRSVLTVERLSQPAVLRLLTKTVEER